MAKGAALPKGTAIVRGNVRFTSANPKPASVMLDCPPGLRVADLLSARGISASYAPGTIVGESRSARIIIEPRPGSAAGSAQVSMLCKAPDASGSIVAGRGPASAASGRQLHVAVTRAELLETPGGAAIGSVRRGQPVRAQGRPVDGWMRVTTDTGATGWVRAGVVG